MFWFLVAKLYTRISVAVEERWKIVLRGRKYLLRKIKADHVLVVDGRKLYFNHRVAGCYTNLISGKYSEPETHAFLRRVIHDIEFGVHFLNVGANIGEMIIDVARFDKVVSVTGFEPQPECVRACKLSVELNGYDNVRVIQKALNADGAPVMFRFDEKSPQESGIDLRGEQKSVVVSASTLDEELFDCRGPAMILIDVEGAEALVLKGGKNYIEREKPLIIFEYNHVSKKIFDLRDIKDVLGGGYKIFRLREDGRLDENYDDTWNCVAVHLDSAFYRPCCSMLTGQSHNTL